MKYEAVLFDMDGVLIDSEELMSKAGIMALHDFGILYAAVAKAMLTGPVQAIFLDLDEFFRLCTALGACLGGIFTFIDITADETSEFLFHNCIALKVNGHLDKDM